jgi:glutamate--cysteine ligase
MTAHPPGLGSSLTNPAITTDYSEAMIEIISPPCHSVKKCLDCLDELHTFIYKKLENDELLWTSSMPCIINKDSTIPPASFGTSNEGKLKELYRKGLKNRYGSVMQSIAGIHFNFSFSDGLWNWLFKTRPSLFNTPDRTPDPANVKDFRTSGYLHIIRNFLRTGWILTLLFGATPAMCTTYLGKNADKIPRLNKHTSYLPFATSLRSSHLGYQSSAQKDLFIATDSLSNYCRDLVNATITPWSRFSAIPKTEPLNQISDSILQIENEYYSPIRPKQSSEKTPRATSGLLKHGIEYIEVRSLDVNPFEPVGITCEQILFTEALLLNCLLNPSPPITPDESQRLKENVEIIATNGRDPEEKIQSTNSNLLIKDEALKLADEIIESASMMDRFFPKEEGNEVSSPTYCSVARSEKTKIMDYELLPSSKILSAITRSKLEFFHLGMNLSTKTALYFKNLPLSKTKEAELIKTALDSTAEQKKLESENTIPFNDFLKEYTSKD